MSVETVYICKRLFLQIEDCERDRNTAWAVGPAEFVVSFFIVPVYVLAFFLKFGKNRSRHFLCLEARAISEQILKGSQNQSTQSEPVQSTSKSRKAGNA